MLSMSNKDMLTHVFMNSRLDYCKALLGGCSARLINKLQMIQNAAARVLTRTRKYDHIRLVLSTLQTPPPLLFPVSSFVLSKRCTENPVSSMAESGTIADIQVSVRQIFAAA